MLRLRKRQAVLVALVAGLLALRVVILGASLAGLGESDDILRFHQIALTGGRPYIDQAVEYPLIFVGVLKLIALAAPGQLAFSDAVIALAFVCELGAVMVVWRTWGAGAATFMLAADSLLIGLFVVRLDLVVVFVAVLGVAAVLRQRPVIGGLLLALAVGMKLWPIGIAVVLVKMLQQRDRAPYVVALSCGLSCVLVAWLIVGGVSGIGQVLTLRGATGWQIESVAGSVVRLVTGEPAAMQQGALRFGSVPAVAQWLLYGAAVAMILVAAVRTRSARSAGSAWVVCTGALVAASAVFSPQFVAWLIPGGAIAWSSRERGIAAGIVLVAAVTAIENAMYQGIAALSAAAMAVLILRNAALVAVIVLALKQLGPRRAPVPGRLAAAA